MPELVTWQELGIANHEQRREPRLPMVVPIEVAGFDLTGRFFIEITETIDISPSGCSFSLKRRVERGAIINIKLLNSHIGRDGQNANPSQSFLYQVACADFVGVRWRIGSAKLQPASLWALVSKSANSR